MREKEDWTFERAAIKAAWANRALERSRAARACVNMGLVIGARVCARESVRAARKIRWLHRDVS